MAKEKFDRSKPHVGRYETIGLVGHNKMRR